MDATDLQSGDNDESVHGDVKATKRRRRLTSEVWKFFDMLPLGPDHVQKCKCKKCGATYMAGNKYGTGNLQRHTKSFVRLTTQNVGQLIISQSDLSLGERPLKFNLERFRELLIYALIGHDLPLKFVEYEGIRNIFTYLCPEAKTISRKTARTDILKLHQREVNKLGLTLSEFPGKICLTSDLWTSIATDGYLSLTAHFIDKNWVLQKRILNFSYMPPPHSGIALNEKVYGLVSKWGIESKLFSMTLDNASANDVFVDMLKNQLLLKNALLSDGSFFHIRCCAHILNLIVHEGLKEIDNVVDKIRECVKYVKGSQGRKQKFLDCVAQTSLDSKKGLKQDVPTRWNSTYLMLVSAIYYRRAFCHLQLSDSNFRHCPTLEEWTRVEKICVFLKSFYDATCVFSGSKYPTSNLYFMQVCGIQNLLNKEMKSDDLFLKRMASLMFGKFEKYWSEYSVILAIAVIFDPRYKFQFVEYSYKKLYSGEVGDGAIQSKRVRDKLFALFDEYNVKVSSSVPSHSCDDDSASQENQDMDFTKDFDTFESSTFVCSAQKSQLELYLDEPRINRKEKLDVLAYWKAHQYRYPELARMARDVLSIPISTVASESAFSTGGRVLDQYRSALRPEIVEALICTRDWLFGEKENEQVKLEELIEDVMNLHIEKNEPDSVESTNTTVVDLEASFMVNEF